MSVRASVVDLGLEMMTVEVAQDPYPLYHRLRDASPVYWSSALDQWLVTGYREALMVVDNKDWYSNVSTRGLNIFKMPAEKRALLPLLDQLANTAALSFSDPPVHTFHRGLVVRPLTPRAFEPRRPSLQARCHDLANDMAAQEIPEVVSHFALPLSLGAVVDIFGAPGGWEPLYLELSRLQRDFFHAFAPSWETAVAAERNAQRFKAHVLELVEQKRREPDASLLTSLVTPSEDGRLPSDDEVFMICVIFLGAAFETTFTAITNAIYGLLSTGQADLIRGDQLKANAAFDEALRWQSPQQRLFRRATVDHDLAGQNIRAGEILSIQLGAANHDPAVFEDPDRYNILRDARGHLAFGHGIHFCAGAGLGRMEGALAITTLLDRFPKIRIAPGWVPLWEKWPSARLLGSLPVQLT